MMGNNSVPPGLAKDGHGGFLTTKLTGILDHFSGVLDPMVGKSRAWALWPMPFGLACCAIEMMSMVGPRFDIARFGAEVLRFSPRQADLMIISGTLTRKMGPACRRIYDEMPNPKWVMAMGACASTGGPFNTYSVVQGADTIVPVDIYVPGCPPRPEAVLYALGMLMKRVEQEGWHAKREPIAMPESRRVDVPLDAVGTGK